MPGVLIRWLILTLAVMLASYMIDGIRIAGFFNAFLTAAILGILNAFLRPLLFIVTLPINVLTFGLFTFVINALMLKMASGILPGFHVVGFWSAVLGSLIIGIVSWLLNSLINEKGSVTYIDLRKGRNGRWR
jgi:putative membrane protein